LISLRSIPLSKRGRIRLLIAWMHDRAGHCTNTCAEDLQLRQLKIAARLRAQGCRKSAWGLDTAEALPKGFPTSHSGPQFPLNWEQGQIGVPNGAAKRLLPKINWDPLRRENRTRGASVTAQRYQTKNANLQVQPDLLPLPHPRVPANQTRA